jgi:hypothetical protein
MIYQIPYLRSRAKQASTNMKEPSNLKENTRDNGIDQTLIHLDCV